MNVLTKMCMRVHEETHMTAPRNCQTITLLLLLGDPRECGGNGHWERDYGETKREWGKDKKSERQKKGKKERERGVRQPADVKVPLITSCFSSAPSLCLSLSVPLFYSHLNSSPSASVQSDVGFWSAITTEMRQSRSPTRTHKLKVPLQVKSGTQRLGENTLTHTHTWAQ